MFGLTTLGAVHTAFSVIALAAGITCLVLDWEISPKTVSGNVYVWMTILSCLTAFGIFQHGGFGKPHVLAVLTLIVLAFAGLARRYGMFGRAAPYVETVGYSLTFLFHLIPGLTETFTRFPMGAPLFSSAEDPQLQTVYGVLFAIFLVGATVQVRNLRAELR